jgi:hypothetical protein
VCLFAALLWKKTLQKAVSYVVVDQFLNVRCFF